MIKRLSTFTCYFYGKKGEQTEQFDSKDSAIKAARAFIGRDAYAHTVVEDEIYILGDPKGPIVMVRQDVESV